MTSLIVQLLEKIDIRRNKQAIPGYSWLQMDIKTNGQGQGQGLGLGFGLGLGQGQGQGQGQDQYKKNI